MEITEEDKSKFNECQEHIQIGYLCAHPTCNGCPHQIPDET